MTAFLLSLQTLEARDATAADGARTISAFSQSLCVSSASAGLC
ncbi:SapB/AmfS family lanthipeptide [Gryllotalpicola reticulitermitis]|uniref:SapB/AmfS family lanthipeptide n=1 Tax=Gryllotalpicola reticulitermitis TaxID=1184153 RepID=A0ABV8QA25_9MICO